jgi:hypothetical protein
VCPFTAFRTDASNGSEEEEGGENRTTIGRPGNYRPTNVLGASSVGEGKKDQPCMGAFQYGGRQIGRSRTLLLEGDDGKEEYTFCIFLANISYTESVYVYISNEGMIHVEKTNQEYRYMSACRYETSTALLLSEYYVSKNNIMIIIIISSTPTLSITANGSRATHSRPREITIACPACMPNHHATTRTLKRRT